MKFTGIKVVMDIDLSSTKIDHPWFTNNPDYYISHLDIPNNWVSLCKLVRVLV